jgi:hypothetical protein
VVLTERQQRAQTLANELRAAGAAVISALPLADNANLRFQVLDAHAEAVLGEVIDEEMVAKAISAQEDFIARLRRIGEGH